MRIIPSGGTGESRERESQVSVYDWKWYYGVPGLSLWLVLILAIAAPKANRDLRILLILVPLLIVNLLYVALKRTSSMPPSAALQSDTFFQSLAIGMAVLWLLAPKLASLPGLARFLLSLGMVAGVAYLGALSIGLSASARTLLISLFLALTEAVLLVAVVAAGRLCRWRYLPGRFMLWLGACEATITVAALLGFFFVSMAATSSRPTAGLWTVIPTIILMGLIFGLCLYVLAVPFMILGFASPFFRDRMRACLSLHTPDESPGSTAQQDRDGATAAGPPDQTPP